MQHAPQLDGSGGGGYGSMAPYIPGSGGGADTEVVLAVKGPGDSLGLVNPAGPNARPGGPQEAPPTWRVNVRAKSHVMALRAEVAGLQALVGRGSGVVDSA